MRVLVTGGVGFIGAATCARLLARGDEVVAVDDFDPTTGVARKEANAARLATRAAFRLIRGDVRERDAMVGALAGVDAVVHLAGLGGVRRSVQLRERYVSVNVHGTMNVLAAMGEAGVHRVVFGSSSSVYGAREEGPFRESDPVRPASPYAATKVDGEGLVRFWAAQPGRAAACLRFFTVYGPGQPPGMAVSRIFAAIAGDVAFELFGDGSARRDHTYIDDVVDAIVAALDRPSAFEVLNVGAGEPTRLDELVARIGAVTGRSPRVIVGPPQEGDVPLTWADATRARDRLGWTPRTGLDDGLRRTAAG